MIQISSFFKVGKHHMHCQNETKKKKKKKLSMHECKKRLNWEERRGSTEVSTAHLALPNQYTQTAACPDFTLTSPPPSINTPIEDLGCAPAHPACGISGSWKPEPYIVSSLTHLDGSQPQPHPLPDLSLPSQCWRMCSFAVNLNGLAPAEQRKLKDWRTHTPCIHTDWKCSEIRKPRMNEAVTTSITHTDTGNTP